MSGAYSIATHKRYGLQRVCRIWQVPRSTVYAHRHRSDGEGAIDSRRPKKRGPMGPCSDPVLVEQIGQVLTDSPFHGEGYRKVWAKLRFAGLRTSKERVRRLMREHGLQAPSRVGHPHGPKAHDGTIITEAPDVMWGTDATTTITLDEGQAYVFVGVDHCTVECTGIHASTSGNRFEALEPIRQGVREHFNDYTEKVAEGLAVRQRSRTGLHGRRFPERAEVSGYRVLAQFRARTGGKRLFRTFHPSPQGESAVGAHLCHHRGIAARLDRLQARL